MATGPARTNPHSVARQQLTRLARTAEAPVLRAFTELVKRQHRRGSLTPAVQETLAESLTLATLTSGSSSPTSRALADAVRDASHSLELEPGAAGKGRTLTEPTEEHLGRLLDYLQVTEGQRARTGSPAVKGVVDAFHRLWYDDRRTWRATKWQGITTWKCPLDLWLYQEIIHAIKPGLIIETGTAYGGSASYLGWLCDVLNAGRVVSVDIAPKKNLPDHPRVTYLLGSSIDPAIVDQVRAMLPAGEPVMVILDSDHNEAHVRQELIAYADLVTPGSYLIVEDTNIHGHPAWPEYPAGPMEAVNWFLKQRSDFEIDRSKHRYHLTMNPRGYLRRKADL